MSNLDRPLTYAQQETFAQAWARGSSPVEAARRAGYTKPTAQAKRNLENSKVCKRADAIQARLRGGFGEDVSAIIEALIAAADKGVKESGADGRGLMAARACLAEAAKLKRLLPPDPSLTWSATEATQSPPARPRPMTQEEWLETYAPPARAE